MKKLITAFIALMLLSGGVAAQTSGIPITQLPYGGQVQASDYFPVARAGVTYKVIPSTLGVYTAGTGLTLTGGAFSVNASQPQITGLGTIGFGVWQGTPLGSNYGGAGAVNGILKANGASIVSAAVNGTDYLSPSTGVATTASAPLTLAVPGTYSTIQSALNTAAIIDPTPAGSIRINVTGHQSGVSTLGTISNNFYPIQVRGTTPISLTYSDVNAVTGTAGAYSVAYDVSSAAGVTTGDVLLVNNCTNSYPTQGGQAGYPPKGSWQYGLASTVLGQIEVTETAGTNTATLSSAVTPTLVGEAIGVGGQFRTITAHTAGTSSITVSSNWNQSFSNYIYWQLLTPETGTVTVSSGTVTGSSTLFSSRVDPGDLFIAMDSGLTTTVASVTNNTSMALTKSITVGAGSKFAIGKAIWQHEGAFVVTGVSGNTITVSNPSNAAVAPPKVGLTTCAMSDLTSVLNVSSGGTSGLIVSGALDLDNIAVVGTGSNGIGIDIRGGSGKKQAAVTLGAHSAILGFNTDISASGNSFISAENAFIGNASYAAVNMTEGASADFDSAFLNNNVDYSLIIDGSYARLSRARLNNNGVDSIYTGPGASFYADWAESNSNAGDGLEIIGAADYHFVGSQNLENAINGVELATSAHGRLTGLLSTANGVAGINSNLADYECDYCQLNANGYGALPNNSHFSHQNNGIINNTNQGLYATGASTGQTLGSYTSNNSGGIWANELSRIDATNSYTVGNGGNDILAIAGSAVYVHGYTGATNFGIALNTFNKSGSLITDDSTQISGANLTNITAANISAGTAGINISGNAATVTTNANLTGPVTSTGNATAIANGAISNAMLANSATTVNGQTCTLGSTCTVTATASNTLTFGTHLTSGGASYNGSAPITITSDAASANTASTIVARDGSGNFAAGTITANLTGTASAAPLSGITGFGTGVATALGVGVGTAGAPVINGGALGTPSGGTLTNATGLPLTTGVTGQLAIGNGGTGQATANAGFNALSPMTTSGDVIYGGASGAGTRLAANSTATNKYLQSVSSGTPSWIQVAFGDLSGQATNAQLATQTANTVLGALTATTPSGLALPSCTDSAGNHLNYTSGTGFSCGTTDSHVGTVTSVTFTGDGTVLSSTPSSAVTTTGTVSGSLANAAAGTVLGNATSSSAAPTYTSTPQLGKAGTLGSLTMGNATSGLLTLQPAAGALGTPTVLIPAASDTLVNLAGTQTLTNKSIAGSEINSGTVSATYLPQAASDGATLGAAAFNTTNFSCTSGVCNSIQGISIAATPQFARIGFGTASQSSVGLYMSSSLNSGTSYAYEDKPQFGTSVTSSAYNHEIQNVFAASMSANNSFNIYIRGASLGSGTTLAEQDGIICDNSFNNASTNYCFASSLNSQANTFLIKSAGTVHSYHVGNFGIGSNTDPTHALEVTGTASVSGAVNLTGISNTATTSAMCINTGTGAVSYDGTIGTCTISDGRLKNVDGPITGALSKILKIKGVEFHFKDEAKYGKGQQIGVIAQDVQKVFPELVSVDSSGKLSADYQKLTAPLIEAIREQQAEIDELKKLVANDNHANDNGHRCWGVFWCVN